MVVNETVKAMDGQDEAIQALPIPVRARLARGVNDLIRKELGDIDASTSRVVGRQMMRSAEKKMGWQRIGKGEVHMSKTTESPGPYAFQLFDRNLAVQRQKSIADGNDHASERKIMKQMVDSHDKIALRPLPKNFSDIMDEMDLRYPHFHEVSTFLRKRMVFTRVQDHPALSFGANVLLDGPAGVGKSSYLIMLSKKLDTLFSLFSCAGISNGFDLVGLSSGWGTGKPGKIHDILVGHACANPIFMLDEVEKAGKSDKSNLPGTLYGLLEKNNAKGFHDEFIDVPMDVSMINWFATSNDVTLLDPAIKDRFVVLQVRAPNSEELKQMIPQIYADMLIEHKLTKVLASRISMPVINKLASHEGVSIRVVKNLLEEALGNVLMRIDGKSKRKLSVRLEDLPVLPELQEQHPKRKPIGFIW